jgi:hypothetical protein
MNRAKKEHLAKIRIRNHMKMWQWNPEQQAVCEVVVKNGRAEVHPDFRVVFAINLKNAKRKLGY